MPGQKVLRQSERQLPILPTCERFTLTSTSKCPNQLQKGATQINYRLVLFLLNLSLEAGNQLSIGTGDTRTISKSMKAMELAVSQEDCWRQIAVTLIDVRAPTAPHPPKAHKSKALPHHSAANKLPTAPDDESRDSSTSAASLPS